MPPQERSGLLGRRDFGALVDALLARYRVIAPRVRNGAIVYEPIENAGELAVGWLDEQEAGQYRLVRDERDRIFAHTVGPQSWKHQLFPPRQELCRGTHTGGDFTMDATPVVAEPTAFLGVRACELAAIAIQDTVFLEGPYVDPGYAARRAAAFIVAVNCTRSGATCFCSSMGTGPAVASGFDIALTELSDAQAFLVEAGSECGAGLLAHASAGGRRCGRLFAPPRRACEPPRFRRSKMPPNAERLLKDNLEHPHWAEVARRHA